MGMDMHSPFSVSSIVSKTIPVLALLHHLIILVQVLHCLLFLVVGLVGLLTLHLLKFDLLVFRNRFWLVIGVEDKVQLSLAGKEDSILDLGNAEASGKRAVEPGETFRDGKQCVLHFTFYVLRFTFYVLPFTFYVLRFTFYLLRFTFYILCFMFYVLCFTFYVLRFTFEKRISQRTSSTCN